MRARLSTVVFVCVFAAGAWAHARSWLPSTAPPAARGEFRRTRSKLNSKLGHHHHSVADVVITPGQSATVDGKFAYGAISKDLEHEDVSLWINRGSKWKQLSTLRTNSDGRARFQIPAKFLRSTGPHRFALVVHGDGSTAYGTVWVLAPKSKVVVFDVDGTLTRGDSELVDYVVTGNPIAMRPAANVVAHQWASDGAVPIYLTGRPYMFHPGTRRWLERHGFPAGPLITTRFVGQSRPSRNAVGRFKRAWLARTLRSAQLVVAAAYGNAKTDVCAFAESGIPPSVTHIIGDNGGLGCGRYPPTHALRSFADHVRKRPRRSSGER